MSDIFQLAKERLAKKFRALFRGASDSELLDLMEDMEVLRKKSQQTWDLIAPEFETEVARRRLQRKEAKHVQRRNTRARET